MQPAEPVPTIYIRRDLIKHCWTIVCGSHWIPIQHAKTIELWKDEAPFQYVASDLIARAGGRLRVLPDYNV